MSRVGLKHCGDLSVQLVKQYRRAVMHDLAAVLLLQQAGRPATPKELASVPTSLISVWAQRDYSFDLVGHNERSLRLGLGEIPAGQVFLLQFGAWTHPTPA